MLKYSMADRNSSQSENEARIIKLRPGRPNVPPPVTPIEDLGRYERSEEPDDYRHRMIVNMVGFLAIVVLIGAGIWLADTMAAMRKKQDCLLSGRRGCAPVEVTKDRW